MNGKSPLPVVRIDNWWIFPGRPDQDRRLTLGEQFAWKLGYRPKSFPDLDPAGVSRWR